MPWKLERNDDIRFVARFLDCTSRESAWQRPQVSGTLRAKTLEFATEARSTVCSPWQSVQTGAWSSPAAARAPWTLCRYAARMPAWQEPQVDGRLRRATRDDGSVTRAVSWLPWQVTHVAETARPDFRRARA
jgi:hypothetical protein